MHADNINPFDVGHRVGDESVQIVPVPSIRLPVKNCANGRRIVGRDGR
jgi:hypothetical protein